MPAFSYIVSDFVPFTKIVSGDVNSRFNDIKVFFNTTKLDDSNLQNAGITRATKLKVGTVKAIIVNDSSTGAMSEYLPGASKVLITDASSVLSSAAALPLALGGTGQILTIGAVGTVLQVNPGPVVGFGQPPMPPQARVFSFYQFS